MQLFFTMYTMDDVHDVNAAFFDDVHDGRCTRCKYCHSLRVRFGAIAESAPESESPLLFSAAVRSTKSIRPAR